MKILKHYFSLIKFSHTIFALPFAFIGATLGYKSNSYIIFPWQLFIYVILCMFFARSAAMAFNRYIDAKFDIQNPRTKNREIPSGVFKPKTVFAFVIINSSLFIITTYLINKLVFILSPLALLIILSYSYTKRFTMFSHIWLGVALALSPIGAFFVFNPQFSWHPLCFSLIVLFWVVGFDIIYAIQDMEVDRKLNLKSIPSKLGYKKALNVSFLSHLIAIIIAIITGIIYNAQFLYWTGTLFYSVLILYEHYIVRKNSNMENINIAFSQINSFAGLLYGIFATLDILL
jgi:4-hydroxybenzoate polyprenyltransferase